MTFSNRLFSKVVFPLAGLLLLSACENPYLVQLKQEFGWTEERMTRDGWLESRKIAPPDVWCYKTIGEADCFDAPRKLETHRLVEKFETVPVEPVAAMAAPPPVPVQPEKAAKMPVAEKPLAVKPASGEDPAP